MGWHKISISRLDWEQKTGSKWVSRLIRKLWEVSCAAYKYRNSVLYDTPSAEIMIGTLSIDSSLRMEWKLGFVGFPNIVKAALTNDIAKVMGGTVSEGSGWFVLVRKVQENIDDRRMEN